MADKNQTNGETGSPPSSGAFKKTGRVIYYGLAMDSAAKSLRRSGRTFGILGNLLKTTAKGTVQSAKEKVEPARTRQQVQLAQTNAATGLVATFLVTLLFFTASIWQLYNANYTASAVVCCVSLVYGFRFFVYLLIWRKATARLEAST